MNNLKNDGLTIKAEERFKELPAEYLDKEWLKSLPFPVEVVEYKGKPYIDLIQLQKVQKEAKEKQSRKNEKESKEVLFLTASLIGLLAFGKGVSAEQVEELKNKATTSIKDILGKGKESPSNETLSSKLSPAALLKDEIELIKSPIKILLRDEKGRFISAKNKKAVSEEESLKAEAEQKEAVKRKRKMQIAKGKTYLKVAKESQKRTALDNDYSEYPEFKKETNPLEETIKAAEVVQKITSVNAFLTLGDYKDSTDPVAKQAIEKQLEEINNLKGKEKEDAIYAFNNQGLLFPY